MPSSASAERIALRFQLPPGGFARAQPQLPTPWWARPSGILLVVALWAVLHAIIAAVFESAINVDDAVESYLVQSLQLSYVGRNPPLFDWLLFALQKITGPGPLSFALLRYVLLFATAMLVYQVARQAIREPRLQALAVYSLSTLWVVGYHSHRILTHSNVMILAIVGTVLTVNALADEKRTALYAWLGVWIAAGILGKFGYLAFFGVLVISCLLEGSYRRVLLDWRIGISVLVAAVPLSFYAGAMIMLRQDVVAATADVVAAARDPNLVKVLNVFAAAWIGYLLPFLAVVCLVFLPFNRGEGGREPDAEQRALCNVLRTMIIIGTFGTMAAVLATGSVSIRDRYFHVFFLLAPVYVFAEIERLGGWQDRTRIYLAVLLAIGVSVIGVRLAVTLWPDPRLCGRCVSAEPLAALRPVVLKELGDMPTLVAADRLSAGRLRAAVPEARVVIADEPGYRPPPRSATGCAQITGVVNGLGALAPARLDGATVDLWAKWWSPLMRPHRESFWQITPLAPENPLCR